MTKVIFETATIADSISKAARVAPTKGSNFDKSAGIVIEVQPGADYPIVIRATDTEVFYMEWLDAVHVEGAPTTWRLPSTVLDSIMKGLPIGSGKQVTLERVDKGIKISQGRAGGVLNVMTMENYPEWAPFDFEHLAAAPGLVDKLKQVEWAADESGLAPLACVRLDGKQALATNRYRLAVVPFELDITEPVLLMRNQLTAVLNKSTTCKIAVDGNFLRLMPDDHTQISVLTYDNQYPRVETLMIRDQPQTIEFRKPHLLDVMSRALTTVGSEREPEMQMYIGREEIACAVANRSLGIFGDVLEIPGQATHKRLTLSISPKLLMDAISQAPDEVLFLKYNPESLRKPLYLHGTSGFEAWVALRGAEKKAD